jgi:hypothetical protein
MSIAATNNNWHEANQRYLMAAMAVVRESLEQHAARADSQAGEQPLTDAPSGATRQSLKQAAAEMPAPPALETLCAAFALSPFERDVLLLCAGVELDSAFAALCAAAQGDPRRAHPTFSLALAALPDPHWSALAPTAPLRRWRLIEARTGEMLTTSPLRIDERVLHYLAGVSYLDERLHGLVEPLPEAGELPPSHRAIAERIATLWSSAESAPPAIQLCGDEDAGKRAIVATGCAALGLHAHAVRAAEIPSSPAEREALARLWEREAALAGSALLIDCEAADGHTHAALALLASVHGLIIVTSREPLRSRERQLLRLDVNKPTTVEQRALWQSALGTWEVALNGQLDPVVAQFNLGTQAIRAASAEVMSRIEDRGSRVEDGDPRSSIFNPRSSTLDPQSSILLWDACRAQARPRLDDLALRIGPAAAWDDLVLPAAQMNTLREIATHVRQRFKVYETWGFAAKSARGLGISALFTGDSGTGKTMAAEVLANELRLDLYRIDLSSVVSKYIGETEKNLRRVFDAAEEGGAVLLFDEADALFGKRSEVKDSHDRYANIEVSYLLQRMEAYRGLAILTTNLKSALDAAFLRRIRFVVQFPFPDAAQRAEIWRRIFPSETPTEGLDVTKLARLNVAGGNIRNIALNAAFLAADAGEQVRMSHLLRAARGEYAKLEKPLTEGEIGGWV